MKALVIGAGRMGRAAAWDLARQPGVEVIRLIDRDHEVLAAVEHELARLLQPTAGVEQAARIEAAAYDLDDVEGLVPLLRGFDVALSAADYRFNEALTRAAIQAKVHLCDLGGNVTVVERQLALDAEAQRRGVTVIPDCGLAPGLAGLLGALGAARIDEPDRVSLRVGGLPAHPRPPFNYKLVFSARGLVNEYLEPAEVLREGELVRVPSLTEVEALQFAAPFGMMEAFHTSGGASTLPRTLRARVRHVDYKTIRYPGHCAIFAGLCALGLLGQEPVLGVVPRELVEHLLEAQLGDDDTDVVLLRVSIEGRHRGQPARLVFELVDYHDQDTGHSAMARATAYPAAAVAYMLGAGAIERRGVQPGELCIPLEELLAAARARGLDIVERWETP